MFTIGVIGSGTMGNGIAHVFALHGHKVVLHDTDRDAISRAINSIKTNLLRQLKAEKINDNQMESCLDNISTSDDLNGLIQADLVIEAATENFNIKSNIFQSLDKVCSSDTILATNTSSISINKIASTTDRAEKVIGMHFMNPVPIMKLVEVINGDKTTNETTEFVVDISKEIGKIPIECNDSPGFVSNRILMPMINEAAFCFMEGVATADGIDEIMKLGMGHPMGPLKLADLIGIDVCLYIIEVLHNDFADNKYKPCPILKEMVQKGNLGCKSGKGFYSYE